MSSEGKSCVQQSTLFSCSLCSHSCILMPVTEKPGNIKLTFSEPGCYCNKSIRESTKLCETYTDFITPKPVSFSVVPCDCEDETPLSTCVSEEEGTHEHKYCDTPDCIHNSQDVQPSYENYDPCPVSCTGACSSQSPVVISRKPLYIDPRLKDHVPKSIEELKASISGFTGLEKFPVGKVLGRKFIEFRCEMNSAGSVCEPEDSKTCEPEDSQTSEPECSSRPLVQGISLTMEPNDHRFCTNPDNCKHTRESSAPCPPCPPAPSPPALCPPEEAPCSAPPSETSSCVEKNPPCFP